MKVWKSKNVFSLGEISPNLYHRFDLPVYEAGLRTLKNGMAKVEGTIVNCPEIVVKQQNIYSVNSKHLRTFLYNVDDRNNYKSILMLIDGNKFKLFKVNDDDTLTLAKEFSAVFTEEEIRILSIIQLETYIMICCKNKKPNLIRIDESNISNSVLVDYWEAIVDPPVKPIKTEYQTTPSDFNIGSWNKSRYGNTVTIKIKDSGGQIYSNTFLNNLKNGQLSLFGNLYRIDSATHSGSETIFKLTAIDESGLKPPTINQDEQEEWETFDIRKISFLESLFVNNKYPALCTYYQGRLVFANIQDNPDFLVFSKTGDYFKFSGTVQEADSGFTLAVPCDERAIIKNIISWNSLIIVTNVGVYSSPIMQSITPSNSFLTRQLIPNFSDIEENYVVSNGILFYVNDFKNKIFSLMYNYDSKMYQAEEISLYSNYMLKEGIKNINRLQYDGEEYIVCEINNFYAMCTINKSQNVTSWNRYTIDKKYYIINIENKTYFLDNNDNVLNTNELSYEIFKNDMEIQLLPPVLNSSIEIAGIGELPYIAKSGYTCSNVRISVIGEYDIEVNGDKKTVFFGHDNEKPYTIQFDNCNAMNLFGSEMPITIKNLNNKRVEISGIYYTVESEKEVI